MSKLAPTSIKYIVKAVIKANGVIEKPDVIGAIFGQTEGLLGSDLDLRELQRTGRIGRIEVNIRSVEGKSEGDIIIPSALDASETSLIAATLETIDRVGPCTAEIQLIGIEDTRASKRDFVMSRAKSILENLMEKTAPDIETVSEQIKESVRAGEITSYHGLPAGPDAEIADELLVVEGRADVLNLLRFGIRNTVAVEGTSIPEVLMPLIKEKTVTIFVDGDRGGQLIAREMLQKAEIDFVAMAPEGKEVEELTKKEAYKALRDKVTSEQFLEAVEKGRKLFPRPAEGKPESEAAETGRAETHGTSGGYERPQRGPPRAGGRFSRERGRSARGYEQREPRPERPLRLKPEQKDFFRATLEELVGTRAACIFNSDGELLGKVPVAELASTLGTVDKPHTVIFDGKVDFRLGMAAKDAGVKFLVGMEKELFRAPVTVVEKKDL